MLALFTDFGSADLYVGQVKAVLHRDAPGVPVLDLAHDLPNFRVEAAAHLLAALLPRFPADTVFLAIVDPGVGGTRDGIVARLDGRWLVGPDNGLLSVAAARAKRRGLWRIVWRPAELSATFHGRDLFAPVAACLAQGSFPASRLQTLPRLAVGFGAQDLAQVVYLDHYGNAITGLRADPVPDTARLAIGGRILGYRRTYGEAGPAMPFWHRNSLGLVEIAVNQDSAARLLGIAVGARLAWEDGLQ